MDPPPSPSISKSVPTGADCKSKTAELIEETGQQEAKPIKRKLKSAEAASLSVQGSFFFHSSHSEATQDKAE